jgi:hypothetical protein
MFGVAYYFLNTLNRIMKHLKSYQYRCSSVNVDSVLSKQAWAQKTLEYSREKNKPVNYHNMMKP